ncbi:MAG: signal peptidase II [Candidatus Tokpelaia sp. JSC189]|nr:MAG: signal peptidase II [Candidatus Tokpelaia sp. JSC189]
MKYCSLLLITVLIAAMVALDQWIKYYVRQIMTLGERVDVLPFFSLYHTRNAGIAFSMLSSFNDVALIVLILCVMFFSLWQWWDTAAQKKLIQFDYLLIIGGALGNLIDRLRFHYVTDYILFHIGSWSFAIFNLADSFITIGAACVVLNELWYWRQEKRIPRDRQ